MWPGGKEYLFSDQGWATLVMNLTDGSETLGNVLKKRELGSEPWKREADHVETQGTRQLQPRTAD